MTPWKVEGLMPQEGGLSKLTCEVGVEADVAFGASEKNFNKGGTTSENG